MGTLQHRGRAKNLIVLAAGFLAFTCSKDEPSTGGGAGSGTGGGTAGSSGGAAGPSAGTAGSSGGAAGSSGGTGGAGGMTGGAGTGGSAGGVGGTGGASAGSTGASAGMAPAAAGSANAGGAGARTAAGGAAGRAAAGRSQAGASAGGAGAAGAVGSGTLKLMAIGDSTTQSTCWRAMLWQTLNTAHAGDFDFVGTHKSDAGCSPSNYDQDNEAYGSSLLSEAVSGKFANNRMCSPAAASGPCPKLADFEAAFASYKPDVALIHYGTNDVWNSVATADIVTGFDDLVDGLRAANANVKIFVAKIIPMNVTETTCSGCSCAACSANIAALNSAIGTWAPMKSTAASPIGVVDQNTGFDAATDTRDGVHPNDSGSQKMAAKWDVVLEPLF